MTEAPFADIPPEEVERRLRELAQLHELGMALRDVRFVDPQVPDRVRERPTRMDGGTPSSAAGEDKGPEDRRG